MKVQSNYLGLEKAAGSKPEVGLDLVVPFTTPSLTQVALDAANRLGTGLDAHIRLIKVQVVPFPMDLDRSPVALEFIRRQLGSLRSRLTPEPQIRLAREFETGLTGVLKRGSIVILGHRQRAVLGRLWPTREEKLAASLRGAGYRVILVGQSPRHSVSAISTETVGTETADTEVRHA